MPADWSEFKDEFNLRNASVLVDYSITTAGAFISGTRTYPRPPGPNVTFDIWSALVTMTLTNWRYSEALGVDQGKALIAHPDYIASALVSLLVSVDQQPPHVRSGAFPGVSVVAFAHLL